MYLKTNIKQESYQFALITLLLIILISPVIKPISKEIKDPTIKPEFTIVDYEALKEIDMREIALDMYSDFQYYADEIIFYEQQILEEIESHFHNEEPIEEIAVLAFEHPLSEQLEETVPETTTAYFPEETREPDSTVVLKKGSPYLPAYTYGVQPKTPIEIPKPLSETDMRNYIGYVNTKDYLYLGEYRITGYTPGCSHCCGNNLGVTTSGNKARIGYTVAAERNLPLGVTLYIEGYGFYVVQDRGNLRANTIDIAAPNHDACYDITKRGVNVYVVPLACTTINTEYENGGNLHDEN